MLMADLSDSDRKKLASDLARLEGKIKNAIDSSSMDELRKLFKK